MKKVHELGNGYVAKSDWTPNNNYFDVKIYAPSSEGCIKTLKVAVPFDSIFGYDPSNREDVITVAKQVIEGMKNG
jgi:hypothetical protein